MKAIDVKAIFARFKEIDWKKVWSVTKVVLVWTVFAIAVLMMIFTLVTSMVFNQNDRSLFGYKFFVVRTDSMAATDFEAGDVIICREVDKSTLKAGDIITFISENEESRLETITHKIRRVTKDEDGDIAFVTYGTTTNTDDEALATMVVGKYQGRIPNLGHFFLFIKSTPGYILLILIPFLLLILSQGANFIRIFRKYREEQLAEMREEREKLSAEREENKKLMEELLALKQQLEKDEKKDDSDVTSEAAEAESESSTDSESESNPEEGDPV